MEKHKHDERTKKERLARKWNSSRTRTKEGIYRQNNY